MTKADIFPLINRDPDLIHLKELFGDDLKAFRKLKYVPGLQPCIDTYKLLPAYMKDEMFTNRLWEHFMYQNNKLWNGWGIKTENNMLNVLDAYEGLIKEEKKRVKRLIQDKPKLKSENLQKSELIKLESLVKAVRLYTPKVVEISQAKPGNKTLSQKEFIDGAIKAWNDLTRFGCDEWSFFQRCAGSETQKLPKKHHFLAAMAGKLMNDFRFTALSIRLTMSPVIFHLISQAEVANGNTKELVYSLDRFMFINGGNKSDVVENIVRETFLKAHTYLYLKETPKLTIRKLAKKFMEDYPELDKGKFEDTGLSLKRLEEILRKLQSIGVLNDRQVVSSRVNESEQKQQSLNKYIDHVDKKSQVKTHLTIDDIKTMTYAEYFNFIGILQAESEKCPQMKESLRLVLEHTKPPKPKRNPEFYSC